MSFRYSLALSALLLSGSFLAAQQPAAALPSKQKTAPAPARSGMPALNPVPADMRFDAPPVFQQPAYRPMTLVRPQLQPAGMHEVQQDPATGEALMIRSTGVAAAARAVDTEAQLHAAVFEYLGDVRALMRVRQPAEEFAAVRTETDALGHRHVRLRQYAQGVEVYGAEIVVHFAPGGEVLLNGRWRPSPVLASVQPALQAAQAVQLALQDAAQHTHVQPADPAVDALLGSSEPRSTLVAFFPKGQPEPRLAWYIVLYPNLLRRYEYIVDAQTGEVLQHIDHTCALGPVTGSGTDLGGTVRQLRLFNANGTNYLIDASKNMYTGPSNALPDFGKGIIATLDMNNSSLQNPTITYITSNNVNAWNNKAVSAHFNAGLSYDYFKSTFNRNSINNQGGDMISMINVPDDDGGGLDNAFWNGRAMFYGNGRTAFTPLARSLDVAGHEMTHGVVETTSNLEYQGESGALNESFADIFGVMIDRDDWLLGEEVVKLAAFPSGALRSMQDPHNGGSSLNDNGWQPRHMNEKYTGTQDNGGVHINSGINNFAFFKVATAIGKDKAEQIYYRALTLYLTRSSQFIDCRLAVVRAASDLHGANSAEVNACKSAYDQVGILDGSGGNYEFQLPVNPGQDFIVSMDLTPGTSTYHYISSTTGTSFQALSNTQPRNKMSVTDNGQVGYFVGTNNHIYGLFMNPSNPGQVQVSNQPEWDNVAISKDGNRLAAVSNSVDTSIYIFNLAANPITGVKYRLYNPTTAPGGLNAGGVLYADAIEWDYTGEYLMYDAFNRITNSTGTDIEYWDVNFLRAWNRSANTFGDGTITPLFSYLPEDVSIGNPVFSKNSPSVIAFDYIEETASGVDYFILASNIERGDVGAIFDNSANQLLGYPCYSKLDNKIIFNVKSTAGNEVIGSINLQADKINSTGNASLLIDLGKWGVWYSTGTRNLNVSNEDPAAQQLQALVFPNPFRGQLTVEYSPAPGSRLEGALYDLMGRQVAVLEHQAGSLRYTLETSRLPAGAYLLRLRDGEQTAALRVIRE